MAGQWTKHRFRGRSGMWSTKGAEKIMTKTFIQPALIALSLASLALGACRHNGIPTQPTMNKNPIEVAESVERLELYSRPSGMELSARDEYAVMQFLRAYGQSGSGPIYINRPSGHQGAVGVAQTDRILRGLMAQAGLNPSSAQSGEYQSYPGAPAPVVVSYRTLKTIVPRCPGLTDLSLTADNAVTPGFGCFASANLAAMVANPRQLVDPKAIDTPNAQRRQVVYDRYINGEATGSARPSGQQISSQSSGG